ncbi:MAG: NADH peroxidase [Clostridiales bacterium]|nr:NADH peroxidase [Clostridiales bacterium]
MERIVSSLRSSDERPDWSRTNCCAAHAPQLSVIPAESPQDELDPEVARGLRGFLESECAQVAAALAMSRRAEREGFPEVARAYRKIAIEDAEHVAILAELLGVGVQSNTRNDLTARVSDGNGEITDLLQLARRARALGYDRIHHTVTQIARDEARHGCAYRGLLKKYFKCTV